MHARTHYDQACRSRELLVMTGVLMLLTPRLLSAALDQFWPHFWLEYRRYPLVR